MEEQMNDKHKIQGKGEPPGEGGTGDLWFCLPSNLFNNTGICCIMFL